MTKLSFAIALILSLTAIVPVSAQTAADRHRPHPDSGATFDSIDPLRTDSGSARDRYSPAPHRRHLGSNGASTGERGTFESGPNDPPPPYTPQREGGR